MDDLFRPVDANLGILIAALRLATNFHPDNQSEPLLTGEQLLPTTATTL